MSKYTLFDQQIVFEDSAERFLDMQEALWNARASAAEEFKQWYHSCGDIATVLKNYPKEIYCTPRNTKSTLFIYEIGKILLFNTNATCSRQEYSIGCISRLNMKITK